MQVFTGQGDGGTTSLWNGQKVPKDDIRIEANGSLDELTSHLGLLKAKLKDVEIVEQLTGIQQQLIYIMSEIAGYGINDNQLDEAIVKKLEDWIIGYDNRYPKPKAFIIPGKYEASSYADIARAVCRRAERKINKFSNVKVINPSILQYINRLSDYLYVVARVIDFHETVLEKVSEIVNKDQLVKGEVKMEDRMTLKYAKRFIQKIEEKAAEMNVKVVIAVCNREGNPIALHVMDDAYIASYDIAANKAFTSVSLKMTTDQLSKLAQPGGPLYGIQFTNNGRITVFGGGTPITYNGRIIGGLGVSGGSAEEDIYLAEYGAEIIKEVLK